MSGARILIVDDDAIVARDIQRTLEESGYDVAGVLHDAEDIVPVARRERADLVLLDVRLAGEADGIEAGARVRRELGLPVIYLTAFSDEETVRRAEATHPYMYLVKPFQSDSLRSSIDLALQRHRTEQRLREREAHFRILIENAYDAITVLDPDGTILYVSPSVRQVAGYWPEDLVGRSVAELVHPDDAPGVTEALLRLVQRENEPLQMEVRFRHRDGSWRLLEAIGRLFRDQAGGLRVIVNSRDVSETRRVQRELERSEERYRRLFEENVAGVFRRTLDGRLLEANEAYARLLGFESPAELEGLRLDERVLSKPQWEALQRRLREEKLVENAQLRLRRRDGRAVWLLVNSAVVDEPVGAEPVVVGTAIDYTDRVELSAVLKRMAYRDPLTGLANRRALERYGRRLLALARRREEQAAMVYVDLARFKQVNDTLGHAAGDEILTEVARRLRDSARESDIVARIGGDEFAILMPEVTGEEGALAAARRFTGGLHGPARLNGHEVDVRAHFGVALYPDHAGDVAELLSAADQAMYGSKSKDDGEIHIFLPPDRREANHVRLRADLRRALEGDELDLHYQPILPSDGDAVEGVEALVRWRHPELGLLTAGRFLRAAEQSRLIRALDDWVLRAAIGRIRDWNGHAGPAWVSVNLSSRSFCDRELGARIAALLEEAGVQGERLVIEITERSGLSSLGAAKANLAELQRLGVRVALDDFGAGHSGIHYLRHFPVDFLKLDRVFVADLDRNPAASGLAGAVVELGHAMGMKLVSEGIERESQRDWARRSGCDFVQGFHLGRPSPIPAVDG